jgi:hypothetical protein
MDYSRYYKQVKSVNNVNITNFTSEIGFEFKTDMNEYIDTLKSFLSVRLRIVQNASATANQNVTSLKPIPMGDQTIPFVASANDFIPYLCKNPVSALFSTGRLSVNDKTISNLSDLSSTNTLIRSVFDSTLTESSINSTNSIVPLSIEDSLVSQVPTTQTLYTGQAAYGVNANILPIDPTNIQYTGHSKYAYNRMGPFKYCVENVLNMNLPFPLFSTYNKDGIPPDNKIRFSLMVDTNYPTNIIQYTGTLLTGAQAVVGGHNMTQYITNITSLNQTGINCPAHTIAVGVADMTLYLCVINKETPVTIPKSLHINQIWSQVHTIVSASETFSLSAPPKNVKYILACFLQTNRFGPGVNPCDFSDGFIPAIDNMHNEIKRTGGAVSNLTYVRFNYKSRNYPQDDYNIINLPSTILSGVAGGVGDSSMELYRLLGDVIGNSNAREDRCGSMYDISKIAIEPIFVHKIESLPNSEDSNMTVSIKLAAGYTNSQSTLLVVCLYDEILELMYDAHGKVISTELIN